MKLSPTQKAILEAIELGKADTVITLTEWIGYSPQTIRLAILNLEAGGYIERKDDRRPYAYRMSTAHVKTEEELNRYNKVKERLNNLSEKDKDHWLYGIFYDKPKDQWTEIADVLVITADIIKELEAKEALVITLEDVV